MTKAGIGFIGAGAFISAFHLVTARHSPIMEIRAIADLDEKLLARHAAKSAVGYVTKDYHELLADPNVDIVVIGTKQDLHARMIVESLNAGKWVLCEKPMAQTVEETEQVLAAEKESPGRLAIGFNRRFAPTSLETRRLMRDVPRPWFINYRLMYPNPAKHSETSFYRDQPRILYEGCHILDLVCWLLEEAPKRVFMTGDRLMNNCALMDFADGSQVSFMCGSMGSYCLWKEYMEIFGSYTAITVSDFTDMRVRGFAGEYDRVFLPHLHEHGKEVEKYGFDFYEVYKAHEMRQKSQGAADNHGMVLEEVRRPTACTFDVEQYGRENPEIVYLNPDKGWTQSLEHFAQCFLDGKAPMNADAAAGALSTRISLAFLESLATGVPVDFDGSACDDPRM